MLILAKHSKILNQGLNFFLGKAAEIQIINFLNS